MRQHAIMAEALQSASDRRTGAEITEIGAGDGHFLLRVAQKLSPLWPGVSARLLDRQKTVAPATISAFAALDWGAEAVVADVFDWLANHDPGGLVLANLFLHHFEDAELAEMLRLISRRTRSFVALEPRRARRPLFCSRMLWVIGCNDVTRHDAVVSVRAGFSGRELSALWPSGPGWRLTERRAGLFSHLFVARAVG
jgi:hypothetical protein